MKRLPTLLLLALLAMSCSTFGNHPSADPAPVSLASSTVEAPAASENSGILGNLFDGESLIDRAVARLSEDFTRLAVVAAEAKDPIGIQCSADGTILVSGIAEFKDAMRSVINIQKPTGFFFTDIERARVAPDVSIAQQVGVLKGKIRKAADSCAPLIVGPEKFGTLIGLPKALRGMLEK